MTSNDANGFAPAGRIGLRKDRGEGETSELATGHAPPASTPSDNPQRWARIERWWWRVLFATMIIFSAVPLSNLWLSLPTKDYGLWYQVGLAVRQGLDIYPRPETGRLFPFMYPPAAAVMLAFLSMLGSFGSLLAMVIFVLPSQGISLSTARPSSWPSTWKSVSLETYRLT